MNQKLVLILFVFALSIHASDKFDFYLLPSVGTEYASLSHSYKNPKHTDIVDFSYFKPQLNAKISFYLLRLITVSFVDKMSFLSKGRDFYTNNLYSKSIITSCLGIEITSKFKKDGPLFIGAFLGNNSIGDPDYKYSGFWAGILAGYDIKDIFIVDLSLSSTKFSQLVQIEDAAYTNTTYRRNINGPIGLNEISFGFNLGYKFYMRNIK